MFIYKLLYKFSLLLIIVVFSFSSKAELSKANTNFNSIDSVNNDTLRVLSHLKEAEKNSNNMKLKMFHIEQALILSELSDYKGGIALSLLERSKVEFQSGLYEHAIDNLLTSMKIFKGQNDYKNEAKTLNLICSFYIQSLDFKSALKYFFLYNKLSEQHSLIQDKVEALAGIGFVYLRLNKPDSTIHYFNLSSKLAEQNTISYPAERNNVILSNAYYNQKDYNKAYEYILKVNISTSSISINSKAIYYYLYSLIEFKKGNLKIADSLYHHAGNMHIDRKDFQTLDDLFFIKYKTDSTFNNSFVALRSYQDLITLKKEINENDFKSKLANFQVLHEIENKKNELVQLRKDKDIIDYKEKQSQLYIIAGYISAFLLLVLLVFIIYTLKTKNKLNKNLLKINKDLKEQKKHLKILNNEIIQQREVLLQKSIKLDGSLKDLKFTQTKLIHTEKMASIGTMTNGIAHEINNPLNFIAGGVLVLGDFKKKVLKQDHKNFDSAISKINKGLDEAVIKVKTLLNISFDSTSEKVSSDLNKLIDLALDLVKDKIPKGLTITKEFDNIPNVSCFKDKILQVFINILNNAIESVKPINNIYEILIKTEQISETDLIRISIFNTGENIHKGVIEHIFDPFFSTKSEIKSTGLGLTTCNNIVGEHNGEIHLFNEENGVVCEIILKVE